MHSNSLYSTRQPTLAMLLSLTFVLLLTVFGNVPVSAAPAQSEAESFRLADPGFRVERIAGPEEATNIYAMTLDSEGRVIVSGPGYIRRLTDRDGDRYLETREEIYVGPEDGCQGLVCVGEQLYFVAAAGLHRMPLPAGGQTQTASAPELVLPLRGAGEHGPHAVRRGADGFLYLLGGNHSGFDPRQLEGFSPVREPYAGLLLRLRPDGSNVEVVAHGMRNAYDFDFLPSGDIIAWDSDGERDTGLPWYRPTRLYHLTPGADCGWRSSGSGKVPTYAMDTVAPVAGAGRGSPTGLVAYQHRGGAASFPERYQGHIFALDWTFGRLLFFPLEPRDATFRSSPEIFLESAGGTAFAPTDVEVAPDGALLISSGGRGLDGAVFRVTPDEPATASTSSTVSTSSPGLDQILGAPMPLSAWSRRRWAPLVEGTAVTQLLGALADRKRSAEEQVRALDVLGAYFPAALAGALRRVDASVNGRSMVRARAAWWAGRHGHIDVIRERLGDSDPWVVRVALESAARYVSQSETWDDWEPYLNVYSRSDTASPRTRRLRQAVAYALSHAPEPKEQVLESGNRLATRNTTAHLFAQVARSPRGRFPHPRKPTLEGAEVAKAGERDAAELLWFFPTPTDAESRLEQLRLLQISYEHLLKERDDRRVFFQRPWDGPGELGPHVWDADFANKVRRLIGNEDTRVSREAARLAGMLGLDDLTSAITGRITRATTPGEDLLTLSFLTRMKRPWNLEQLERVARAVLGLAGKVEQLEVGRDARWHRYTQNLWQELTELQPRLTHVALAEPPFGHPDHTALAEAMQGKALDEAVRRFTAKPLPNDPSQRRMVVSFLASHPQDNAKEVLRKVLDESGLQGLALNGLAENPSEDDRALFLGALGEGKRLLVPDALTALTKLPIPDVQSAEGQAEWLAALLWGFALDGDPHRTRERDLAAQHLARLSGTVADFEAESKSSQRKAFETWRALYPGDDADVAAALGKAEAFDERFAALVAKEGMGDAKRGAVVFRSANCASCHTSGSQGGRFGPDLSGLGQRFSRTKTLEAIYFPDREVADRYRTRLFVLNDGKLLEGLSVYNSPAATLVRTRDGGLHRLDSAEIAQTSQSAGSFMPAGLLDGLTAEQIEDLVAYLRR